MNWKKFFIAFIASFVFIFIFGYLWFGMLMNGPHMEVPALWRTESDFGNHFPVLILGHVVMAFFITCIYASFVPAGGPGVGAKLGVKLGLLFAGNDLISFAVQPLTTKILCGWIVGDLIMFAIAGAIVGAIYKPGAPASSPMS
jgi:hypothetical protein